MANLDTEDELMQIASKMINLHSFLITQKMNLVEIIVSFTRFACTRIIQTFKQTTTPFRLWASAWPIAADWFEFGSWAL